ncbi:MAG: FAD-binding protein, partial [Pseudomonadota bacterium]|nr:FAD-binding protein [Pseudomonadota bacterium]
MNTLTIPPVNKSQRPKSPRQLGSGELGRLRHKIEKNTQCEILFSQFDRGRYATDASHYQIFPIGVVIPTTRYDLRALIDIAREFDICLTGRGGGTSQNGQAINQSLVIDYSKYLNQLVHLDVERRVCHVEPGIVLDHL